MGAHKEIFPISSEDKLYFERLYEEYKNFMFYSARKYVNNQSECEDIVQDTVERLLRNISAIRKTTGYKLRKYIVLTVRAAYLDNEKRKRGDYLVCIDDNIQTWIKDDTILLDDYEEVLYFDIELLKRELPLRDWVVLEGKYIMGYSQNELGQIIGISPDSIRMLICRARRKARAILLSS